MHQEEKGTFPELNCLSSTSEYLQVLVSWQACLASCLWQAQPYRCAQVSGQGVGASFPEKPLQRGKHTQQHGALDLSNGTTPSPACILLCASTRFRGSRKDLAVGGGEGCRGGRILYRWGRGKKLQSQLFHPALSPH